MADKNYKIVNEDALKKELNISNWGQLSKDKFIKFLDLIPSTDPEIIKQTISQFPKFVEMTKELFVELRDYGIKAIDSGDKSYVSFVNQCNTIISTIQKKLDKENLTPKQEQIYLNELHSMMDLIAKKESEHKNFILKILGIAGTVLSGTAVLAAAILGVNIKVPFINKK